MELLTHNPINRETWLHNIADRFIRPHFQAKGYTIPANVRLSCSLPSGGIHTKAHQKRFTLGETFNFTMSGDSHFEIMIVPSLADPARIVDVLIHEFCHVVVGLAEDHGKVFKQCAYAVGLEGKPTSTTASPELLELINTWLAQMPAYPHAELATRYRKQTTRNLACKCLKCGYALRASSKWLKLAIPKCPLGHGKMWADIETEGEDY